MDKKRKSEQLDLLNEASHQVAVASGLCMQVKGWVREKDRTELQELAVQLTGISGAMTRIEILNRER